MTSATTSTPTSSIPLARDPSSLSNPHEAHITHLSWDAVIDFTNQQFFAKATYNVTLTSPDVTSLKLDTSDLDVQSVKVNDKTATFSMTVPDDTKLHLGSCLDIDLLGCTAAEDENNSNSITVAIMYTTSTNASAAQWLPPEQTAGKKYPYVFSACFVSVYLCICKTLVVSQLVVHILCVFSYIQHNVRQFMLDLSCRVKIVRQ